jgi:hypothetical protein
MAHLKADAATEVFKPSQILWYIEFRLPTTNSLTEDAFIKKVDEMESASNAIIEALARDIGQ